MLSCSPAHAARRSDRALRGSRSSSAPTWRRKARICDRVSSSTGETLFGDGRALDPHLERLHLTFCRLGQVTAGQARREFDADVTWLPFDLHPEYPPEGISLDELHRRYGMADDPLPERFAAAGLEYNRPGVVPNTKLALRVSELAREQGLHDAFHDRLMDAYWSEALNIGSADELRRLAAETGVDDVDRVLGDPTAYLDVVEGSTRQAYSIGVNAVPAFLLDRRLIVMGAQPIEVFRQAFSQLSE
ncbi:MAG TPA: DsbA family protein [Gaiellaceae bacterium]|nr:DsbA family protein [Gaiellaceae bacterium]